VRGKPSPHKAEEKPYFVVAKDKLCFPPFREDSSKSWSPCESKVSVYQPAFLVDSRNHNPFSSGRPRSPLRDRSAFPFLHG